MKVALDKIKGALSTKDQGANYNYYRISDNTISCGNGMLSMGTPYTSELSCLLPGVELTLLLSRLPEAGLTITVKDNHIKFASGRTWGRLPTLPVEQLTLLQPEHSWQAPPPDFLRALKAVRPFIAEVTARAWGTCACLHQNGIMGTNNIVVLRATCEGLTPPESLLVPFQAIDLITKRDDLTGLILEATYLACLWSDGTWLRTQLIGDKFPEAMAAKMLDQDVPMQPIPPDWRNACRNLAEISESILTLEPDKMHGGRGKAYVETEITSPVNAPIHFNPKFLGPVLDIAQEWALDLYPKPVLFQGDGVRGVLLGRQA